MVQEYVLSCLYVTLSVTRSWISHCTLMLKFISNHSTLEHWFFIVSAEGYTGAMHAQECKETTLIHYYHKISSDLFCDKMLSFTSLWYELYPNISHLLLHLLISHSFQNAPREYGSTCSIPLQIIPMRKNT